MKGLHLYGRAIRIGLFLILANLSAVWLIQAGRRNKAKLHFDNCIVEHTRILLASRLGLATTTST